VVGVVVADVVAVVVAVVVADVVAVLVSVLVGEDVCVLVSVLVCVLVAVTVVASAEPEPEHPPETPSPEEVRSTSTQPEAEPPSPLPWLPLFTASVPPPGAVHTWLPTSSVPLPSAAQLAGVPVKANPSLHLITHVPPLERNPVGAHSCASPSAGATNGVNAQPASVPVRTAEATAATNQATFDRLCFIDECPFLEGEHLAQNRYPAKQAWVGAQQQEHAPKGRGGGGGEGGPGISRCLQLSSKHGSTQILPSLFLFSCFVEYH
jgi:hypothetical protein